LGLSTFIAFTMPKVEVSKPRIMIGGYIVGIVVGCLCHYLFLWSLMT
jgi:CBS-domain-containing membrane protein